MSDVAAPSGDGSDPPSDAARDADATLRRARCRAAHPAGSARSK